MNDQYIKKAQALNEIFMKMQNDIEGILEFKLLSSPTDYLELSDLRKHVWDLMEVAYKRLEKIDARGKK